MSQFPPLSKAKLVGLSLLLAVPSYMLSATESSVELSKTSLATVANSTANFSASYSAYQQAVTDNNDADIFKYSAESYELGRKKFGDKSLDTANLALNYAAALEQQDKSLGENATNEPREQAHQLYLIALAIYEVEYGDDAVDVLDPLLGAAKTNSKLKLARSQLRQAVEIAEDSERPLLLASVQMSAFNKLKNTEYYDRRVRDYALNAFEIYQQELAPNALKRVEATYIAGMIWLAENKESKAIPLFEEVITQFSKLDYSHPYELASHARLVELYEEEGESEQSTKHCLAIGSMRPWQESQEQTPLYRVPPKYPISAARRGKEGWVQIAFTVDEYGFVTEPKVLDSRGGVGFEKSSLKTLKKWRYAPKFVDGKAVAAESRVQLDFTLNKG
ncbi:MAG: energy transducer TonB [Shewanella sp.]|nr:energy transducer TonB [Shewanella sp.]